MNVIRWFLFLMLCLPGVARADLKVIATVPDLAALAKEVGGDLVTVQSMSEPTQDPHFVDARPNLALALAKADALVLVGLDLEIGWLPTLVTGSRNPKIQRGARGYLDASAWITPLDAPAGPIDRAMGDIHPGGNPHYLFDPRNGATVARALGAQFGMLDPTNAATYQANAEALATRLEADAERWAAELGSLRGKPVVAYHKSLVYMAQWLGFDVVEHLEPKPGITPTPAHVSHVLQVMTERGVTLVLQEGWYPSTTSALVADRAGAKVVSLPGGADFAGGQTYEAHMDALVEALKGALEAP